MSREITYAGFWLRLLASLIDTVCLTVVAVPLQLLLAGKAFLFGSSTLFMSVASIVIGWILPAAIILVFWRTRQATPGKMALGLHVVDATSGATLTLGQSLTRYLGYYLTIVPLCLAFALAFMNTLNPGFGGTLDPGVAWLVVLLPFAVGMLGVIWVGIDRRKQGWHDKVAGSVVVRMRDDAPVAAP